MFVLLSLWKSNRRKRRWRDLLDLSLPVRYAAPETQPIIHQTSAFHTLDWEAALNDGDVFAIEAYINELKISHPELAEELQGLFMQYDFAAIRELLFRNLASLSI